MVVRSARPDEAPRVLARMKPRQSAPAAFRDSVHSCEARPGSAVRLARSRGRTVAGQRWDAPQGPLPVRCPASSVAVETASVVQLPAVPLTGLVAALQSAALRWALARELVTALAHDSARRSPGASRSVPALVPSERAPARTCRGARRRVRHWLVAQPSSLRAPSIARCSSPAPSLKKTHLRSTSLPKSL